jgi:hypothetical protein
MIESTSIKLVFGHGAKVTTAGDTTPGIIGAGYEATLYVVTYGSIADTLTYTLQDSEDNSNWASASTVVNGVAAQTPVLNAVQNTSQGMLVLHSAVRKYHRLLPGPGAGNNVAAVTAVKIGAEQALVASVDLVVGR